MESTTVVFRVDSSYELGTGHVKRCLALADEFVALRISIKLVFITRNLPGNISEEIVKRGHEVIYINYRGISKQTDCFDLDSDLKATIGVISSLNPDFLIVDHYQINAAWESQIRNYVADLVVIDDYLNHDHDCSYFFNQNYYPDGMHLRSLKAPDKGIFIGTRYALLSIEYSKARQNLKQNFNIFNDKKAPLNCLIYFGGSDIPGLTLKVLYFLKNCNYSDLNFHLVIGVNNLFADEIREIAKSFVNVFIHEHKSTLVDLISLCDFAIGSPGSTTWERMCLGVPSILISIAENQDSNLKYLESAEHVISAGTLQDNFSEKVREGLKKLLSSNTLASMKKKNFMLVDGYGSKRILALIFPEAFVNYQIRRLEIRDIYDCFIWFNDPIVRSNSIKKSEISWEDHEKWFFEKFTSNNSKIYILEINSLPIGVIRFDYLEKYSAALISLTIDPIFHGRGYGKKILFMGMRNTNYSKFIAFVKNENEASKSLFASAGFVVVDFDTENQLFRYELIIRN